MNPWRVEFYISPSGNIPVKEWLEEQAPKVQAKFARIFDLLQEQGTAVGEPYIKPLTGKLYEVRVEQDKNIYRTIYFAYTGRRFIMLHGFQKKTQKTPRQLLDLAEERMKTLLKTEASEKIEKPESKQKKRKRR
jgi:phage-related protein